MTRSLQSKLIMLVHELIDEYGVEYVRFALKKMNEVQEFFIPVPEDWHCFDPILKVLEIVIRELDEALYSNESGVDSMEQAKEILTGLIQLPELNRTSGCDTSEIHDSEVA